MEQKSFAHRYALYKDMFSKDEIGNIFLKFSSNEHSGNRRYQNVEPVITRAPPSLTCHFQKINDPMKLTDLRYAIRFRVKEAIVLKRFNFTDVWCRGSDVNIPIPFELKYQ